MRRQMFAAIFVFVFAVILAQPAISDERRPGDRPEVRASETSTHNDEDKKSRADRDKKEKLRLEIEARREVEKKKWLEDFDLRHNRYPSTGGEVIVVTSPPGDGGGAGPVYSSPYVREQKRPKSTEWILFAPSQKDKSAGFGVQWLGPKRIGATAWVSGAMGWGDDVIDAGIPHDDYWLDDSQGTYVLEATFGFGSGNAMLTLGAGMAITETYYTAVSNVTGWEWKAGTDTIVKPAAHASLRFQIADRVNLQFGYDTAQYAFFGLSGSF